MADRHRTEASMNRHPFVKSAVVTAVDRVPLGGVADRAVRACIASFSALIVVAAACGTRQPAQRLAVTYPEPRFPSYLKPPASVEDVLPHVRPLARNKIGFQGNGLGIARPGDTVAFILAPTAEAMIVEAVKRAMEERGVKVNLVPEYEVAGVSREDAAAFEKARRTFTSEQGYMEATWWVEANFHDPDAVKSWLKGRRPDLYDQLFPKSRELSVHLEDVRRRFLWENVGKGIQSYLTRHPEVRGVFWGKGGGTFLRRNLHPMEDKFLGLFMIDNRWDVMSLLGTYPGDVWQLAEDQTIEPLVHVDRLTIKDPEGTDVAADIS
jgi:hypothetical protein